MNNPYQAPESKLIDRSSNGLELLHFKKVSTWLVLLYIILTLGLYGVYWIYSRTKLLNNLPNVTPLSEVFILVSTVIALLSYPLIISDVYIVDNPDYIYFSKFISIAGNLSLYFWAFRFRNRFNKYLDYNVENGSYMNHIMIFFFNILYLSYKLNENMELQEYAARYDDTNTSKDTDIKKYSF